MYSEGYSAGVCGVHMLLPHVAIHTLWFHVLCCQLYMDETLRAGLVEVMLIFTLCLLLIHAARVVRLRQDEVLF